MSNEPMFPIQDYHTHMGTFGLSIRDYFAAVALPAVMWQCAGDGAFRWPEGVSSIEQLFAVNAYKVADEMMKEGGHAD